MVTRVPAVLLGGPPHAGKSVLLYNLTHALQERGVRHHAIRACPDGEGNWSQERDAQTVSEIRRKGTWTPEFLQHITFNVQHRCLPFLVDMGGHPQATELPLFRQCTHAVLLLRADEPVSTSLWQDMLKEANLLSLAHLTSQLQGTSAILSHTSPLLGTIKGLERQSQVIREDEVFLALVKCIENLFNSYSPQDLERAFLEQAPSEPIDLPTLVRNYTSSAWWEPKMLVFLLKSLPENVPLSLYGKAPNWLYAALAVHAPQQPLFLFDPKLPFGWVQPARVYAGEEQSPEVVIQKDMYPNMTVLRITFPFDRIEYFQPDPLAFPSVPRDQGLVLDGRIPYWLLTALVRLYTKTGVPWLAVSHIPPATRNGSENSISQSVQAVVVYSQVGMYEVGGLVTLPVVVHQSS